MRVLVMPNLDKKNAVSCTRAVIDKLHSLDVAVTLDERFREPVGSGALFLPFAEAVGGCDFIVAIGGDGTILHSSKHAVEFDKPLLGVNVGRLGFMAGLEMPELDRLSGLVDGSFREERRMMLDCFHYAGGAVSRYLALNDVVVTNGSLSRMIDLDVDCDGSHAMYYRADGVILSTPTGSTAYALSAGGPMIEPGVSCICLTPICPHSLLMRTVIFSDDKTVTVRPGPRNRASVYLTIDGEQGAKLNSGDRLEVRRSEKQLRLISLKSTGFYQILSNKFKLHWTEDDGKPDPDGPSEGA